MIQLSGGRVVRLVRGLRRFLIKRLAEPIHFLVQLSDCTLPVLNS